MYTENIQYNATANKQIFKTRTVVLFSAFINDSWQCFQIGVWLLKENILRPKVNCLMSKMNGEIMELIDRVSQRGKGSRVLIAAKPQGCQPEVMLTHERQFSNSMPMKVYLETKATGRLKEKPKKSVIGNRLCQVEKQTKHEKHFFPEINRNTKRESLNNPVKKVNYIEQGESKKNVMTVTKPSTKCKIAVCLRRQPKQTDLGRGAKTNKYPLTTLTKFSTVK